MTNISRKPNVIIVMTDDQGYGDLGCTGNPWIKTPNIDRFYSDSVRFTDFHVSPLCTPTRGAVMSGRYPVRNGAWATTWGRSFLRADQVTMAQIFQGSGYRTGMFGKWHLGDTYPYRPQDRGFGKVVAHKGGGVGQTPDFWGNSYFNDTYFHNGEAIQHTGYCTDIWFDEAMMFIKENKDHPFFCYIATNAPHAPYLVADKYAEQYRNNLRIVEPEFYGMITNIDENFGELDRRLHELNIADNSILIFMTDNGSSGATRYDQNQYQADETVGYNAGMRGGKGSYYEGGHRVPFFIRWPNGGIRGGKDIHELVNHIDMIPTFIELCGLESNRNFEGDGVSFKILLDDPQASMPDRDVFVQYRQNTDPPEKWTNAVMNGKWRLIHGRELYNISDDPGQKVNVADQFPEIVEKLRQAHERFWGDISPDLEEYCPLYIGSDEEDPVRLDSFDAMGDVAWDQSQVRKAMKYTGTWNVEVLKDGIYEFVVRRWPCELGLPIDASLTDRESIAIHPTRVKIKFGDIEEVKEVQPGVESVTFNLELKAAVDVFEAWFIDDVKGETQGAYYVYVTRK